MDNKEISGKEMLEKYDKLSEEEKLNFWSNLLLILSLGNTTEEEGE